MQQLAMNTNKYQSKGPQRKQNDNVAIADAGNAETAEHKSQCSHVHLKMSYATLSQVFFTAKAVTRSEHKSRVAP